MSTGEADQKKDTMKILINGKPVTLYFTQLPNREAADFTKKALLNTYFAESL